MLWKLTPVLTVIDILLDCVVSQAGGSVTVASLNGKLVGQGPIPEGLANTLLVKSIHWIGSPVCFLARDVWCRTTLSLL